MDNHDTILRELDELKGFITRHKKGEEVNMSLVKKIALHVNEEIDVLLDIRYVWMNDIIKHIKDGIIGIYTYKHNQAKKNDKLILMITKNKFMHAEKNIASVTIYKNKAVKIRLHEKNPELKKELIKAVREVAHKNPKID